jgi:hypothetical protein
VAAGVVVDAALLLEALHVAEQIDGDKFLVREPGAEVAQPLIFQVGLSIVSPADAQVEGDELLFHKLNSTPLRPSAFLLLIRIINISGSTEIVKSFFINSTLQSNTG